MGVIHEIIEYPVLITHMEGANNYTWLYFRDGRKQLVSKPLRYFEQRMPDFLRIHKTALVNPQYVRDWQAPPRRRMAGFIRMQNDTVLPVGRRRWEEVVQKLAKSSVESTESVASTSYRSIVFLTDDQTKSLLFQQTLEQQCPDCLVHTIKPNVPLPELMRALPDNELPVLILLDARTAVNERLTALQRLKIEPRTAIIPTLLLVAENAHSVVEKGYANKANSVVMVSEQSPPALPSAGRQPAGRHATFVQAVVQLAQYWLSVTALPLPRA